MRRDVFQAIADPTRRAILVMLATHAMTPNALAERFESSRQAVSKHLKILAECDLLRAEASGREVRYSLKPDTMREIDKWVAQFRQHWIDRFDSLDNLLSP